MIYYYYYIINKNIQNVFTLSVTTLDATQYNLGYF